MLTSAAEATVGFELLVRCWSGLNAIVHLWKDKEKTIPYNLTGHTALAGGIKAETTDEVVLIPLTVSVSDVDENGNTLPNGPADGVIRIFADATETALGQPIAEVERSGMWQAKCEVTGFDSAGIKVPIAFGYAFLLAAVVEDATNSFPSQGGGSGGIPPVIQ